MKWFKRILIALGLLLAIALALPFLVSLDHYIPQIEQAISSRINEPVSIKSIRLAALPVPHVTVEGIALGKTDDIKLGKVTVTPDLFSSLRSTRVIRSIEIDSPALTQKGIDKIQAWAKQETAEPQQPTQLRVKNVRVRHALVQFGKTSFGPFDARVSLDSKGSPEDASLATEDGKLKASIRPGPSNYLIDVSAKAWALPAGPALMFDELTIRGAVTLDDARLGEVDANLYGGTAHGKMRLGWRKGLQLDGSLMVNQLEMQKIAAMLSSETRLSGRLNAQPVFSASASSADQLMNALRLETPFNVHNGVLYGVDIQKAATNLVKQGTTGGETRFDELSGYLVMEHGSYRFSRLKIASGALAVDGDVNVSAKKALSGRINAQVKAMGTSTSIPLNVAGTTDAPLLYPTRGTVAGAAVGTAIMGPGVGTSVGAKVGGWVENLFGKKAKPKK